MLLFPAQVRLGLSGFTHSPFILERKAKMSTLKIPTPLRPYTNGTAEISVQGANVAEVMRSLISQHPALKQHLYTGDDSLRPFVNIFIGQDNIKDLQGLDTPVAENAQLRIIPSIAGGSR